jgi:hypothetical protein
MYPQDTCRCSFENTTLDEVKVMDLPLLMGEYKQLCALMRYAPRFESISFEFLVCLILL